jgi:hypothetical protein
MSKITSPIIKMDYENLLKALDKTHTLSVADVCEFLKVGRNWVSEYITSNVPHIFIQGTRSVPNWRAIINCHLNKNDSELIWFSPDQLFSFLENSIAAFSRQTVAVSPFAFMTDDSIQDLYCNFEKNYDSENALPLSQYLPANVAEMESYAIGVTARSKVKHIPITPPQQLFKNYELKAIRALIGYSGIDEVVRRKLYKSGHSRLELNIKGKKGKTGKLVFFVDYNNYIFPENRNIELTDIGHLTDFKNIVYNYIWTIPYEVYASRFEKIVSGYFPK